MDVVKAETVATTHEEMIACARERKLWIYLGGLHEVWFTPDELEKHFSVGSFASYGVESFLLRTPVDMFVTEWKRLAEYVDNTNRVFEKYGYVENASRMRSRVQRIKVIMDDIKNDLF